MPWSCFPSSLFLFKLTLAPRTKTSNKPQEGGGKLGKRKLQPQHNNPQARTPSLQHNHHTCYCGLQLWDGSNLQQTPTLTTRPRTPPQAFLSVPPLSFTVLMTRHKLPHIHPSRAKIITLQLTTGMRTKLELGHRRGFA